MLQLTLPADGLSKVSKLKTHKSQPNWDRFQKPKPSISLNSESSSNYRGRTFSGQPSSGQKWPRDFYRALLFRVPYSDSPLYLEVKFDVIESKIPFFELLMISKSGTTYTTVAIFCAKNGY